MNVILRIFGREFISLSTDAQRGAGDSYEDRTGVFLGFRNEENA